MTVLSNDRKTAKLFLQSLTKENAEKVASALAEIHGMTDKAVVLSGSMRPILRTGDIVTIDITKKRPKSGDVVVFVKQNMQVVHRVLYVHNGMVQTKGDASKGWDLPIPLDDVVGIVPELSSKYQVLLSVVRGAYLKVRGGAGRLYRKVSNRHIKNVTK